jgi:hypothetical protein
VPGYNNSWVDAIGYNGGGAEATGVIGYDLINRTTGLLDSGGMAVIYVSAYAEAGNDKFEGWNNAGYSLCVGSVSTGGCSYASAGGGVNNNLGTDPDTNQYYSYITNQMSLGVIIPGFYESEPESYLQYWRRYHSRDGVCVREHHLGG